MDDSVANNVPVSLKFYFEILLASLGVLPFVRGEFKNYICSRDLKIRTASQWTGATCMEANINLRVRAEVHLHQFGCNLAVLAGEAFNRFVSSGSCSAERLLNTCHCSTDFIQIGLNRYRKQPGCISEKKDSSAAMASNGHAIRCRTCCAAHSLSCKCVSCFQKGWSMFEKP